MSTQYEDKMDLDQLEELCDKATPGPWEWVSDWDRAAVYSTTQEVARYKSTPICKRVVCSGNQNNEGRHGQENWSGSDWNDAQFIAAANPAVVKRLIALARKAQEPAIPEGDRLDMIAAQAARDVGGIFTDTIAIKSLVVYARAVIRNFVAAAGVAPQEPAVKAEWISVEDRLPEVGQEVLVYRPKSERGTVTALARLIRYEGACDYYWDNSYPGKGNMHLPESITHWQSMPDGPAKEKPHV